jgi:DHA1 family inner membrane transport protein
MSLSPRVHLSCHESRHSWWVQYVRADEEGEARHRLICQFGPYYGEEKALRMSVTREHNEATAYAKPQAARSESAAQPEAAAISPADRPTLFALCSGVFLAMLTFFAPPPFFPEMAQDLNVEVALLGQVVASMLLLSAVAGLVTGPLADVFGCRRFIVLGLVAAAVCLLIFGLAPAFVVLLVAALVGGLGDAAVFGPSYALAGTHFGAAARRALGWITAGMSCAAIVGVPLLTAIGGQFGWQTAFVIVGIITLGAAWLAFGWLPRDVPRQPGTIRVRDVLAAYQPLLRHGPTLRLYGAAVLRAICWYGLLTYFGAFLGQQLGLTTDRIGIVYMFGGVGYFLGGLVAGGPLGKVSPRNLLVAGNVAMALLVAVAYSAALGTIGTAAMLPLVAFAGALGWVALAAALTAETPAGAATTMTLNSSLFNVGAAGGGAIGGLLLALSGYGALAIGVPLFGLASAALAWRSE